MNEIKLQKYLDEILAVCSDKLYESELYIDDLNFDERLAVCSIKLSDVNNNDYYLEISTDKNINDNYVCVCNGFDDYIFDFEFNLNNDAFNLIK